MITALALLLGGMAVGYLLERRREQRFWDRIFIREFTRPQMTTTPPTLAELNRPTWMEDA